MSFELSFIGASGGPLESGTCALIIKPAEISYSDIISSQEPQLLVIDAGAGIFALSQIIADPDAVPLRTLSLYKDSLPREQYTSVPQTDPFAGLAKEFEATSSCSGAYAASQAVIGQVHSVLVTHPHLDHIAALVLNSPGLQRQGRAPLTVCGSQFTIDGLRNHVFNDIVWPDLISPGLLELRKVEPTLPFSTPKEIFTVTMFEISHGRGACGAPYPSSAYLLHHNSSGAEIAVFGDFECDSVSGTAQNSAIWHAVAPSVDAGTLKALVVECSTPTLPPGTELYGHLTPPHLASELEALAALCPHRHDLANLNVIVSHVKDSPWGTDPRRQILDELRQLCDEKGLAVQISVALSGMSMVV
ncbi:putative 3,5-cyclic-nucleotide phosphodiesterase [Clavispora lusitaniae]|uniref:3,5-cyclic-nucleotide phosphodiesterase n=1 Tax=Clavispora lusitaniae TaxID=36911 RepID=A0ACD0WRR5_CLALS|nr:putative 3,5-cyclic-nucleotide phosphodiesterase [Clavispora lusitaniae]QFZ35639.1 putative 3,5-cyclic-nucleotide phosphodiesterase [Clavispora lusitaniae]QFZ41321.1 putative 3,5-cyclic-nucleotide phosphodiesterase [Clavispora lusitaniae]QFZ46999.1 putative 3,5-cyclic-nucleotide phosphodiesterase [Clavispora lusitaniae]QFZ52676.1 putative 3,5-cyclic-nucleotide phosphodiesterase [Clavispora lusitaniae]